MEYAFPPGPRRTVSNDWKSYFLVELAPNGTNVFSAYLGGPGNDQANGIALDLTTGSNVIAYIVGTTTTTNFPGTAPFTFHGGKNRSDAFVSRIQFP